MRHRFDKLRKRLQGCYEWLEKCNNITFIQQNINKNCKSNNYNKNQVKVEDEEKQIMMHSLDAQLKISRENAFKSTERLQDRIIFGIFDKYEMFKNNEVIDEIIWLIKNRVGIIGFTEQLAAALSNVLISTFEFYQTTKPKNNGDSDGDKENKGLFGYQRKLDPLIMEYNKLVQAEQLKLDQDIKKENRRKPFGDVIVVTSLLEKATNLGGISRTCEIFGVKKMIVNDRKVIKRDDFKKLSVTSQDWLPIEAIARNELIEYLRFEKTKNGYFIIGLEQTTNSILLNEMNLLKIKCIIVIGKENRITTGYS